MKNKKGFLEISFSWIFAIIVGIIILGGAIYGLSKFTHMAESTSSVKGAKEISILLNPLETSFEVGETSLIILPVESRIYTSCDLMGNFGTQGIKLSEKVKGSWSQDNQEITSSNKYLFSEKVSEGKTFYLFSKPFEFPFKVASLIFLTSKNQGYCFIDSPSKIEEELENLNQANLHVERINCSQEDIEVCFDRTDCDINVNHNSEYLTKRGETFYFKGDALMFAAIFSEKGIYDCQVKRLMKRTSALIDIYLEKDMLTFQRGCQSSFASELRFIQEFANNLDSPQKFEELNYILEELENKNKYSNCALW
jgi:hypothetical protein